MRRPVWLHAAIFAVVLTAILAVILYGVVWIIERHPPAASGLLPLWPFALLNVGVMFAFGLFMGAADQIRWLREWAVGTGFVLVPTLIGMAIWPDWPPAPIKLPLLIAAVAAGGLWAMIDHWWQRQKSKR